jgi:hypothetical protein
VANVPPRRRTTTQRTPRVRRSRGLGQRGGATLIPHRPLHGTRRVTALRAWDHPRRFGLGAASKVPRDAFPSDATHPAVGQLRPRHPGAPPSHHVVHTQRTRGESRFARTGERLLVSACFFSLKIASFLHSSRFTVSWELAEARPLSAHISLPRQG